MTRGPAHLRGSRYRGEVDPRTAALRSDVPAATGEAGPCRACLADLCHLCTGVGCYGCPPERHPRHGVTHTGGHE